MYVGPYYDVNTECCHQGSVHDDTKLRMCMIFVYVHVCTYVCMHVHTHCGAC